MAKLILKSGYTKDISHVMNYITYTGEKLEAQNIIFNDGSVQCLEPDEAINFSDYENVKTVQIVTKDGRTLYFNPDTYKRMMETEKAIEHETVIFTAKGENLQFNPAGYIDYIGNRPHVATDDIGGLFDVKGSILTKEALQQAGELEGHTWWTHILSVTREDGERTGYDCRETWESLVRSKIPEIAKLYNISMENLVMYGAYHDKELNPHVHLFITSKSKTEGFVKGGKEAMSNVSEKMKSMFFNQIFKDDVSYLKEQKNTHEQLLKQEVQDRLKSVSHKNYVPDKNIATQFNAAAQAVKKETGRQVYGYMSADTKQQINQLLKVMVEYDNNIKSVFNQYLAVQQQFVEQYIDSSDKIELKMQEISSRFFEPKKNDDKTVHNAIIKVLLQDQQFDSAVKKELSNDHFSLSDGSLEPPPVGSHGTVKKEMELPTAIDLKRRNQALSIQEREKQEANFQNLYKRYHFDNDISVCYKLGKCYLKGSGCEHDIGKAIDYFSKAANINPYAAYQLFRIYYYGSDGIDKDQKLALRYLDESSIMFKTYSEKNHNPLAHYYLGEIQSFYNSLSADDILKTLDTNIFSCEFIKSYCQEKPWVDFAEAVRHYHWAQSIPKANEKLEQLAMDKSVADILFKKMSQGDDEAYNALKVLLSVLKDNEENQEQNTNSQQSDVKKPIEKQQKSNSTTQSINQSADQRSYTLKFAMCRVIGAIGHIATSITYTEENEQQSKISKKQSHLQPKRQKSKLEQQQESSNYMSW